MEVTYEFIVSMLLNIYFPDMEEQKPGTLKPLQIDNNTQIFPCALSQIVSVMNTLNGTEVGPLVSWFWSVTYTYFVNKYIVKEYWTDAPAAF